MREHRLAAVRVALLGALGVLALALPAFASGESVAAQPGAAADTQVPLTVTLAGNGTGSVTDTNFDFNCPTECTYDYDVGDQVELTARTDDGSTFAGWSGAGCSGTGSCIVTMSAAQAVTATFSIVPPTPRATLQVDLAGSGTGSVTDTSDDFQCPTECSPQYDVGAEVVLTATPGEGATFAGWSGAGCSGTGSCIVTMSAAQTVSATFLGPGHGTVSVGPPGRGHRRVHVRLRMTWRWAAANSVLERVRFSALPAHARVTFTCAGSRCPFHSRTGTARRLRHLVRSVEGEGFHGGDRLQVTISARHRRAEHAVITVRHERRPIGTLLG